MLQLHQIETLPQTEKTCIFTKKGELLWRSPAWTGGVRDLKSEALVAGHRYFEFIHCDDLPPLLAWFKDEKKTIELGLEGAIAFRCIFPDTGEFFRCIFVKTLFSNDWLVVGTAVPVASEFPAPPCVAIEDSVPK